MRCRRWTRCVRTSSGQASRRRNGQRSSMRPTTFRGPQAARCRSFSCASTFWPESARTSSGSQAEYCIEQLARIGFSSKERECFMGQLSHRVDIPFPLFDADNHLYEPPEALTKYLPKEYKDVVQYVEVNGRTKIAIRGQISNYIPNPTFSHVAKPGAWEEYFKFGNPEGKSKRELFGEPMRSIPAFFEPGPRLELMNELGIDRSLMFPTLASLIEERLRDDPVAIHVIIHSLNQWLDEVWGFNYQDRKSTRLNS